MLLCTVYCSLSFLQLFLYLLIVFFYSTMASLNHITDDHATISMAIESGIPAGFHRPIRSQTCNNSHVPDESIIPYNNTYQKLNSSMQIAWAETIDPRYYSASTDYQKVAVLMLSWEEPVDDLKVQQEVNDLKDVFENIYRFHVTLKEIRKTNGKTAQAQVNAIVATWVLEHDAIRTLLLVYFAGHGRPTTQGGELELNPHRWSPDDAQAWLNRVVWNYSENNLRGNQSDVLEIFDCCYAGTLGVRFSVTQAFEYIAACGADDTTARPGKESFTAALIWALKELAQGGGRFTTTRLLERVRSAPDFPSDQEPVLSSRRENHTNERIVIHPLSDSTKSQELTLHTNGTIKKSIAQQEILTLKFVFDARPSEKDIRQLGKNLNHVVYRNELNVNRVVWGGIRPHANDAVFAAISSFKARRKINHSAPTEPLQAATANLAETMKDVIEESVTEQVHEQLHQEVQRELEFEGHSAKRRWTSRSAD